MYSNLTTREVVDHLQQKINRSYTHKTSRLQMSLSIMFKGGLKLPNDVASKERVSSESSVTYTQIVERTNWENVEKENILRWCTLKKWKSTFTFVRFLKFFLSKTSYQDINRKSGSKVTDHGLNIEVRLPFRLHEGPSPLS